MGHCACQSRLAILHKVHHNICVHAQFVTSHFVAIAELFFFFFVLFVTINLRKKLCPVAKSLVSTPQSCALISE